jgi:hypothetical protein
MGDTSSTNNELWKHLILPPVRRHNCFKGFLLGQDRAELGLCTHAKFLLSYCKRVLLHVIVRDVSRNTGLTSRSHIITGTRESTKRFSGIVFRSVYKRHSQIRTVSLTSCPLVTHRLASLVVRQHEGLICSAFGASIYIR